MIFNKIFSFCLCIVISHLNIGQVSAQCYQSTYFRGWGDPLSVCNPDEDQILALCYPKCRDGYFPKGLFCYQQCRDGYHNTGLGTCWRTGGGSYTKCCCGLQGVTDFFNNIGNGISNIANDAGNTLSNIANDAGNTLSKAANDAGNFFKSGFNSIFGRKKRSSDSCCGCRLGYVDMGCFCQDVGDSYKSDMYGRGAGVPLRCNSNQEQQGALCYTKCAEGYDALTGLCWLSECRGAYTYSCKLHTICVELGLLGSAVLSPVIGAVMVGLCESKGLMCVKDFDECASMNKVGF